MSKAKSSRKRVLSGIKPTGKHSHVGNYFGALRHWVDLEATHENFIFVADYHALTTVADGDTLRSWTFGLMVELLAVGLDPDRSILFRQSDIPEVTELTWILSCSTPHGLLERAHAFKDARQKGEDVNAGLFGYPVLMASDILIYGSHLVPTGKDQKQHIEIARDVAQRFNATYGECLVLPDPLIHEASAVVTGLDGRKMSKSYGNTIDLFESEKSIEKKVMSIVTDSKTVEEPKDPETCNVFALYRLADPDGVGALRARYLEGGMGYGEAKKLLFEKLMDLLAPIRARREALLEKPEKVEEIYREGAERARTVARETLDRCRAASGLGAATR